MQNQTSIKVAERANLLTDSDGECYDLAIQTAEAWLASGQVTMIPREVHNFFSNFGIASRNGARFVDEYLQSEAEMATQRAQKDHQTGAHKHAQRVEKLGERFKKLQELLQLTKFIAEACTGVPVEELEEAQLLARDLLVRAFAQSFQAHYEYRLVVPATVSTL
ncbi:MAG TPA: hypothetical protein VNG90_01400 [Candidatus Acidoferrum sp.]|nr:hypothetical protein [Candidatus Acidoferrum sp.]